MLRPPSYTSTLTPDLTAGFSNLNLRNEDVKPTVDQCIAHLKLLEAFYQLREDIGSHDGLYGIRDELLPVDVTEERRTVLLVKVR